MTDPYDLALSEPALRSLRNHAAAVLRLLGAEPHEAKRAAGLALVEALHRASLVPGTHPVLPRAMDLTFRALEVLPDVMADEDVQLAAAEAAANEELRRIDEAVARRPEHQGEANRCVARRRFLAERRAAVGTWRRRLDDLLLEVSGAAGPGERST